MKLNRQLSNGAWVECGERTEEFIELAATHSNTTVDEIKKILNNADRVKFGTDWNENLVDAEAFARYTAEKSKNKKQQPAVEMVKCSCGHTIKKHLVMSTSSGPSCPDCYDRMSE